MSEGTSVDWTTPEVGSRRPWSLWQLTQAGATATPVYTAVKYFFPRRFSAA